MRYEVPREVAGLFRDLRFAVRGLRRRPAFTAAAVLTLAIGLGANSAIFSLVHAVLYQPLPLEDPDRLMMVWDASRAWGLTEPEFMGFQEAGRGFEALAAYSVGAANVKGGRDAERVSVLFTSADLFGVLGVSPSLGRAFTPEEDSPGGQPVVVLSSGFWQRRHGADRSLVGSTIQLDDRPYTVVGVLPDGLRFPLPGGADVWLPLQLDRVSPGAQGRYLRSIGRMSAGAVPAAVARDLNGLNGQLIEDFESRFPGGFNRTDAIHLVSLREQLVGASRVQLVLLLGAVGFVLLIACANVASLTLIHAEGRYKEIAVQRALGASRARVVADLMMQSLVICAAGATIGLLAAAGGVPLVARLISANVPFIDQARVNAPVLFFTAGLAVCAGVLSGLAPALRATSLNLQTGLNDAGRSAGVLRGSRRRRGWYVAAEVALAFVLLVGAGLLIQSLRQLQTVNLGFEPANVVAARVSLSATRYPDPRNVAAFLREVQERIAAPGEVDSVGASSSLPLGGAVSNTTFQIEGREEDTDGATLADFQVVTPGYFHTMGIRLSEGRLLEATDREAAPDVVIINEAAGRRFWPQETAVGRRFRLTGAHPWMTVVGVVDDVQGAALGARVQPKMYLPQSQASYVSWLGVERVFSLVVKSASSPASLVAGVRRAVALVDPDVPVWNEQVLESVVASSTATQRFLAATMTLFSATALLLASIGIYGMIGYSVLQRTQEIGVRTAVGATSGSVVRLVLRDMARPVAIGVAIGLLATRGLTGLLSGMLFGVSRYDPVTIAGVAILLVSVALLASYIPARRATRIDPVQALRGE